MEPHMHAHAQSGQQEILLYWANRTRGSDSILFLVSCCGFFGRGEVSLHNFLVKMSRNIQLSNSKIPHGDNDYLWVENSVMDTVTVWISAAVSFTFITSAAIFRKHKSIISFVLAETKWLHGKETVNNLNRAVFTNTHLDIWCSWAYLLCLSLRTVLMCSKSTVNRSSTAWFQDSIVMLPTFVCH